MLASSADTSTAYQQHKHRRLDSPSDGFHAQSINIENNSLRGISKCRGCSHQQMQLRRKGLATQILLTVLATLVTLIVTTSCKRTSSTDQPTRDGMANLSSPDWEVRRLDGEAVKSSDFVGKVVLLNFWATWCAPCRMEIPSLIELQRTYADRGLVVLGVSIDEGGASVVRSTVKQAGINSPVLIANDAMLKAFGGIEAVPTSFIIDWTGHIVGKHVGFADKADFEASIKPLLQP